ncbi:MAG TPA: SCO family protein [Trebonia sp.]
MSPVPASPAPGFTLTDQDGRTLSLSSLRSKVVVLEFMDPHCTDICPIVSQEYVDAYRDLGPLAGKVVFAAVNVNQYHATVADMMAYSREQRLTSIPGWHFFTGPVPDLRKVWNGYNIEVEAPSPDADIMHTSAVYSIDPAGREQFVAAPMADHTTSGASYLPAGQITAWGRASPRSPGPWPAEHGGSEFQRLQDRSRHSRPARRRVRRGARWDKAAVASCFCRPGAGAVGVRVAGDLSGGECAVIPDRRVMCCGCPCEQKGYCAAVSRAEHEVTRYPDAVGRAEAVPSGQADCR